jgi:glycosyltransferase involved in cell wall biosynthesis
VAIPTLDGAAALERTLAAVRAQTVAAEVVVLDSSSADGTRAVAVRHGAAVHVIPRAAFGHGSARNRLMELTSGERVAFLTQDAVPAHERWLERLLAPEAELTYGPYEAPPGAPVPMRREYAELFADPPQTWVSSANLCLSRAAWRRVPFRDVPYAEDQHLARDLRAAGMRAVYVRDAAVVHGHDYGTADRLRRYFDEFRALHELYGWTAPASPRILAGTVRAEMRKDRAFGGASSLTWHAARVLGAALGTRAGRLPAPVRRSLSLERRA